MDNWTWSVSLLLRLTVKTWDSAGHDCMLATVYNGLATFSPKLGLVT